MTDLTPTEGKDGDPFDLIAEAFANPGEDTVPITELLSPAKSFDYQSLITGILGLGWNITDFRQNGPSTVVIFTDGHTEQSVGLIIERLEQIREIFPYELLGLENYFTDPETTDRIRGENSKKIDQILQSKDGALLTSVKSTQSNHGGTSRSFRELFANKDFKTVGVETDQELYLDSDIAMAVINGWSAIRGIGIEGKNAVISVEHELTELGKVLQNGEAYLSARYDDYHRFDFSRLPYLQHGEQSLQVFPPSMGVEYAQHAQRVFYWADRIVNFERNLGIIPKFQEELKNTDNGLGVLVFGTQHTISNPAIPEGRTLQQLLTEQDISYVVVECG